MLDSILLVEDDVTRHNCSWLVHHKLWIVQFTAHLSINAVKPTRRACQSLVIFLKCVLFPGTHVAKQHRSEVVSGAALSVVMALGGVGSKVESISKPLKVNVLLDVLSVQTNA